MLYFANPVYIGDEGDITPDNEYYNPMLSKPSYSFSNKNMLIDFHINVLNKPITLLDPKIIYISAMNLFVYFKTIIVNSHILSISVFRLYTNVQVDFALVTDIEFYIQVMYFIEDTF